MASVIVHSGASPPSLGLAASCRVGEGMRSSGLAAPLKGMREVCLRPALTTHAEPEAGRSLLHL